MFDNLTDKLGGIFSKITSRGVLNEKDIDEAMREIRVALLEADVALPVVKEFIARFKEQALGEKVVRSIRPGQIVVKIVHEELVKVLGSDESALNFNVVPPAVILMAGLQGAGKTTSTAKLALFLKERQKKKVMLVSTDVYRPAAIEQLKTLARDVGVEFFASSTEENPVDIANKALKQAKLSFMDVLIVDTAGRLHVDEDMMKEIKELHAAVNPIETLFVVDAMTGQDAANTAKAFSEALPLTGVILTKIDGDARGGAALSVRRITGKPIKFLGAGEKIEALEPFHPDRMASRILDMGDVLTLVEELQRKVDTKKAEKMAEKFKKGKGFDLEDFREQIGQLRNMGGMMGMLDKLPGINSIPDEIKDKMNDKEIYRKEAIINSMTPKERRKPEIIKGSRKKRIAEGSGFDISEVNKLLKEFDQMQKMMKRLQAKGGMRRLIGAMKGMVPPGYFG